MGDKLKGQVIKLLTCSKDFKSSITKVINGLKLTLYQYKPSEQATDNWLQVIHFLKRDHWILDQLS